MSRFMRLLGAFLVAYGAPLACGDATFAARGEEEDALEAMTRAVVVWDDGDLPCLGDGGPLVLSGGLPYVKVGLGRASASWREETFLVDFGTSFSTIDRSTLPPPFHRAATGCERSSKLGELCTFDVFDFLGDWGPVSLRHARRTSGDVRQVGILGTDLTSTSAITIDYERSWVRRASRSVFCDDAELLSLGFTSLSTAGFFSNELSKLRPLSDVVAKAPSTAPVANVPTVPLRIGGIVAHAQLDTGFADALVPFSLNVNEALLRALRTSVPDAIVRDPDKDLVLSTCVDESEPVEAYALRSDVPLDFLNVASRVAKSFYDVTLFVKRTPPAAQKCGGVGTWTAPAAQVSASFLAAFGSVVFDPFGSRVWVKREPG